MMYDVKKILSALICYGGMLASPTSRELTAAMKEAARHMDIFTGIHATVSPGSYYTIDGIPLGQIPYSWANNEPDNKNNAESCIAISAEGNISDVSCDIPRPYLCYRANSLDYLNICGTPDPEYRFNTRTNKCYKSHTTRRSFKRAHFVCSAEGGQLVIINSETESEVIRDLFAEYPPHQTLGNTNKDIAFVGFHNYGESHDFATGRGQSLLEAGFSRFDAEQPDNHTAGEYCGSVFRNGVLNDLSCEEQFPFICEKDTSYPLICNSNDYRSRSTEKPSNAGHSIPYSNFLLFYIILFKYL